MSPDILVVDARDNVATALRPLEQREFLEMAVGDSTIKVTILEPIPFGHKIALRDVQRGEPILKYGEVIGLATERIARGEHVHVHNVEGLQGRGQQE